MIDRHESSCSAPTTSSTRPSQYASYAVNSFSPSYGVPDDGTYIPLRASRTPPHNNEIDAGQKRGEIATTWASEKRRGVRAFVHQPMRELIPCSQLARRLRFVGNMGHCTVGRFGNSTSMTSSFSVSSIRM